MPYDLFNPVFERGLYFKITAKPASELFPVSYDVHVIRDDGVCICDPMISTGSCIYALFILSCFHVCFIRPSCLAFFFKYRVFDVLSCTDVFPALLHDYKTEIYLAVLVAPLRVMAREM